MIFTYTKSFILILPHITSKFRTPAMLLIVNIKAVPYMILLHVYHRPT
jgi:hypothetical protein